MRLYDIKWLAALLTISFVFAPVYALEIRSTIATDSYTWNSTNFAGFYSNFDNGIMTETLTTTVTDSKLYEPDGLVYETVAMAEGFDFYDWGEYLVIGFLGEKYFAGYLDNPDSTDDILFEYSDDENVLVDEQLLKILIDNDDEITVYSDTPLKLEESYELAVKAADNSEGMLVELTKNGEVVDSDVLLTNETYFYRRDIGTTKDIVTIAAHFDKIVSIENKPVTSLDGLWQISDIPIDVSEKSQLDKMTIQTVTSDSIIMNNEGIDITLSKNKMISLMPGIGIKTADADELQYYIFSEAA